MRVTNLNGDIDRDGDFDEIHCVGTRSFSIWDADNKTLVYDSGDDFELYTSTEPSISSLFNSDHENNSLKVAAVPKDRNQKELPLQEFRENICLCFIGKIGWSYGVQCDRPFECAICGV